MAFELVDQRVYFEVLDANAAGRLLVVEFDNVGFSEVEASLVQEVFDDSQKSFEELECEFEQGGQEIGRLEDYEYHHVVLHLFKGFEVAQLKALEEGNGVQT